MRVLLGSKGLPLTFLQVLAMKQEGKEKKLMFMHLPDNCPSSEMGIRGCALPSASYLRH